MRLIYLLISFLLVAPLFAVEFDNSWKQQKFPLISPNQYKLMGNKLEIYSQDSVSILYRPLEQRASTASWNWNITQSVPATNLRQKGGDDRNIAIYFLFLPEAEAQKARGKGIVSLLKNKQSKALIYTYGGSKIGERFQSPYGQGRAETIVLSSAMTGSGQHRVNLASDFQSAYGHAAEVLVGVGISSDSDDTGTSVIAAISNLRID